MRVLNYSELKEKKGIRWTRMHLGRLEARGEFPRRIHIGQNSVAWSEDEIDRFLASKMRERDVQLGDAQNAKTDGSTATDG